jgi:hypothetical protein
MIKIVVMFLLLMLVVSMAGNLVTKFLRGPEKPPPIASNRAKCANCGRTVIGTAPCVCGKG